MIYGFERPLLNDIALRIQVVCGDRYAILVDTAMLGFEDMVKEALDFVNERGVPLAYVVNTHAHHDHIGLNGWVQAQTAARVVGHPWGRRWTESPDTNYQEFVLAYPDIIHDSLGLRQEVRHTMGDPVYLDVGVTGHDHFYPGGIDVEVVDLSGHVPGEIGLLVGEEETLIIGDVLIGLNMPMFHGYVCPAQFRSSLRTIRELTSAGRVTCVKSAHIPELNGSAEIVEGVSQREKAVNDMESVILDIARGESRSLKEIWLRASEASGKRPEFRGLEMVAGHIRELCSDGRMQVHRTRYRTT